MTVLSRATLHPPRPASAFVHLVYEIVDNSVDEALAGYCDSIEIELLDGGGVRVKDNGRGIPVKEHPVEKIPTVTLVLTVLHAGGKFGEGGYKVSGGLHGVGSSVVNALSERMIVDVRRDGYRWHQEFELGVPVTELERMEATDETGTTIEFYASKDIFETTSAPSVLKKRAVPSPSPSTSVEFAVRLSAPTQCPFVRR